MADSSIVGDGNEAGPDFVQKEKRHFLKTEHKQAQQFEGVLRNEPNEKTILNTMLELVLKSN